ncbi:MAG: hypothetical protein JSU87_09200 [Gemmatimonadota bacterium]|nr:MAG: hypothetical protein JSU87_09200 [Gemmatimonadota bacterium]
MPWWSWVWVAIMLVLTLAGAVMDLRDREPLWYTVLGVASGTACIIFVLNFFRLVRLGNLALPAVLTLAVLVYEAWHDVRADPDLTVGQKALAVLLAVGLFAPAPVLGVLARGA